MTTSAAIGWAIAFTCVGLPIYFAVASHVGRLFRRQKPAQDEWDAHVAEAIALTQADIDALVAWDDLEFAAAVLADIDELPGGDAA